MKVSFDARYLESNGGGVGKYIKELFIEDSRNSYIALATKPLAHILEGIQTYIVPAKFHSFIWEQVQLPFILSRIKPDIYHATSNYGIPLFCPVPAVLTVHDIIPLLLPQYFKESKYPFFSKLLYSIRLQIALLVAKKIIITNTLVKKELHARFYVNDSKIQIIPYGLDEKYIKNTTSPMFSSLAKYDIKKPYILNNGGLDDRKNLERLIRAFAKIQNSNDKKLKDTFLVITGENQILEEKLKKLTKRLTISKKVTFIGYVEDIDIYTLIKNAVVVIYPTLYEGFGFPTLEAMALKKIVIASDIPILRLVCKDIPLYVDPYTINSIYDAIVKGLTIPQSSSLLEEGRKIAISYTWKNAIDKTHALYREVIKKTDLS